MMATYALTGNDTLILQERVIKDMADGSIVEIAYQNDRVAVTTGKNDNTIYAEDRTGSNAVLTLRVIRGSSDDRWLNGLSIEQNRDLPSFKLLRGSFSKRIGNGYGEITYDNYMLIGGVFQKYPDTQENLQGETEQGSTVYQIIFSRAERAIG